MNCQNWDSGRSQICGHSTFDHGTFEWLPTPFHPQAKMVQVSTACTAIIDRGGDEARPCRCVKFIENEDDAGERHGDLCQAHNLELAGSTPAPATKKKQEQEEGS